MSLTPLFALWRWAFTMLNGFELGTYVFCGFMFPITILPGWAQVIAGALGPTWATKALSASTPAGGPRDCVAWWAVAIGVSLVYLALSFVLSRLVDKRARATGQLALA